LVEGSVSVKCRYMMNSWTRAKSWGDPCYYSIPRLKDE
jgi:hypothetical protein